MRQRKKELKTSAEILDGPMTNIAGGRGNYFCAIIGKDKDLKLVLRTEICGGSNWQVEKAPESRTTTKGTLRSRKITQTSFLFLWRDPVAFA